MLGVPYALGSGVSGDYAEGATVALEEQDVFEHLHQWRLVGALEKANSIMLLTRGLNIRTVLEIGAGTGAVLEQLDANGYAEEYYAIEPSEEAHRYMRDRNRISRLVESDTATLEKSRFRQQLFDLVVLSHVLEHVEQPARLLSEALRIGSLVLLEVPLEGNWAGNVRAILKSRITGVPRENNAAGHVQFFSRSDVNKLVHWCGGTVVRSRVYVPRAQMKAAQFAVPRVRRVYSRLTYALSVVAGDLLWSTIYHGHYAALVRRRPSTDTSLRTSESRDTPESER